MKLRYLFIITFCLIVIIPMSLFWMWPYSKALDSEIKDVKERHLIIAKNLSGTFERYYQDVTGLFSITDNLSKKQLHSQAFETLLKSYNFNNVVLIDNNGEVLNCLFSINATCPSKIDNNILQLAKNTVTADGPSISTVTEDTTINSGPILLVVKKSNKNILLAYLSTEYIIKMGKRVSFGEKGHAAIVDQAGNVLAHPLDSWIKERKNIAKISAVKKMLQGKTGVEQFYSPAIKADMIAGYTYVTNAKWGVMVPQPIKELKDKAKEIDETAILVMLLGVSLAFLISIPASIVLIEPLEKLSKVIKLIEKGDSKIKYDWDLSKVIPLEIRDLKESFSAMMEKIEKNKNEISNLAYFDSNTGLPNRNYFYNLSNEAIDKMSRLNKKGALVFIDFNDFKSVNDTHGHRVGDELLYLFGRRLERYFSLQKEKNDKISFYDTLPAVIPARLGGDEFVILFQNIENKKEIELKIKELFSEVFVEYELNGEIGLTLSGSAGVALFPEHGKKYDELMKLADIAMYGAKSLGKNKIQFSLKS